ncbi:MAG: DNA polymerase III subunit delta [Chlamydiae bacterium]|nr:DNA polymerase III subunit delta [Chlamydiota bacterium]MBI3267207.1 DNA polymerase III subunit delta [Chlamydiota bacterium]
MATSQKIPRQIFFFFGPDEFLLREKVKSLLDSKGFDFSHEAVETLDGAASVSMQEILASLQTLPLFTETKYIWIKNLRLLEKGGSPEEEKIFCETIEKGIPLQNVLIITHSRVDQRRKIFMALKKISIWEEISLSETYLKQKIEKIAQDFGKKIHFKALSYLMEELGDNPARLTQELEKIAIHVGPSKTQIEVDDISNLITSRKEEPFYKFADAFVNPQKMVSLKVVRQLLLQDENPIGMILHLVGHLRMLIQARTLVESGSMNESEIPFSYHKNWIEQKIQKSPPQIMEQFPQEAHLLKQHPYRIHLLIRQSLQCSLSEWIQRFLDVYESYWELVNSKPAGEVLEKLILKS